MADLLLTEAEIEELTDCTQPAAQIRNLRDNGIPHTVSSKGRPRVPRAWLEGMHRVGSGYADEPDLQALG